MEIKPRFSYFTWTHTKIQGDEPCIPPIHDLLQGVKTKEIRQWKMENGKLENGGLANSAT